LHWQQYTTLTLAALAFIVSLGNGQTVQAAAIAGYQVLLYSGGWYS
jgi:hypothetical protein